MVKAIFFDIDGTLISFKTHTIPESTISALKQLKQKGIKLFLATGRPPFHLNFLIEKLPDIFDGYITLNGQYCYDNKKNVIHEEVIEKSDLISLAKYLKDKAIACGFMELDYYYFNLINEPLLKLSDVLGDTAPEKIVDDVKRTYEYKTYQLNIFLPENEDKAVLEQLPNCKTVRWCPYFSDVIPKNGGKPVGISHILNHYNISLKESMAFGDGGNDKEMLQFVNIGVAMGNAKEDVKEIADYITTDVDNDGILYALKHFKIL